MMNSMDAGHYTRGSGILEDHLAGARASKANGLIPEALRQGRVLDIGCGTAPCFLLNTHFAEKYGIDPEVKAAEQATGIHLSATLIDKESPLPFADAFFSVIVTLGTVEHFDEDLWEHILSEAYRLLIPGGRVIFTTPAAWTYGLLTALASVHLISPQEIKDARHIRSTEKLITTLIMAGFKEKDIVAGSFQFGLNRWFCAVRS